MSISRAQLRWRCRRGLKELDFFFEAFLKDGLDRLADDRLAGLQKLLQMQDQDLLAGLLGDDERIRSNAGDESLVVARIIRACVPRSEQPV